MEIVKEGNQEIHPVKMNGDTYDIIQGIMDADKCNMEYVTDECEQLRGDSIYNTCKNIWNFVRANIPYREDESGKQWIQSPGQLWLNRSKNKGGTGEGGDCKSMSIFCSSLLKCLGITDFKYRFVSEDADQDYYHVYIVVMDDSGEGYITLDCTLKDFDRELNIAKWLDADPSLQQGQCPYPAVARMGGPTYIPGETAEQNEGDLWNSHENSYKSFFFNNSTYVDQLKSRIATDIQNLFGYNPTTVKKTQAFVFENWEAHMTAASMIIYHYWGDTTLYLGDFAGKPFPKIADVDIWIGQTQILVKQQNAKNYVSDLNSMGIKDAHILEMVKLSVFKCYGITLDYMLYRCYNKLAYGQEWGPLPGVPYFDANKQQFFPNGAKQKDVTALQNAFPIDGGTGKPWGTPYIAKGVFVVTNGATNDDGTPNATLKAFTAQVDSLGWTRFINTFVFPGGNNSYTPIPDADIAYAMDIYYKWQQGQLPVLYASQGDPLAISGYRMGNPLAPALVVAIVIACVQAITLIVNGILQYISASKLSLHNVQNLPACAPADFKLQYETTDGCYIGYTATCPKGVIKICWDGSTKCDPDLSLPENTPPVGTKTPGGDNSTNIILWGGAALALTAGVILVSKKE